ncbi:uncharacterized protein LOC119970035 [Scyliorhinus canicula]|uniref:uncharacterized protein LOC119970035 n=1 Tax=Scyliorhinus canicula TaxID=7830 RepID=UPI0018F3FA0C|nr:uncharacterized protein LOC119970035 [Scyliorhinus canicula]
MDSLANDAAPACLVRDGRLLQDEDTAYSVSTASECGDREELKTGRRSLNKQANKGKPWRKHDAAYGDGDGVKLTKGKSKTHLSKPYLKRPEKTKSRKKVVAARRKYRRRTPKQKWNTSSASDEDGDSLGFRHRRPNASKFSKIGPNSCVFLPVPEDIFIEDMLSDNPQYRSNSQLKSVEYWSSVAAELPPYQGPWRPRRYY